MNILAEDSKDQKYLGHRRRMPRTLWNDLLALVSHALNLVHIPKKMKAYVVILTFSPLVKICRKTLENRTTSTSSAAAT